jgi:hypothetical protein
MPFGSDNGYYVNCPLLMTLVVLGGRCWAGGAPLQAGGIPPYGLAVPLDCRAHNTPG